jgi:hypothetical protein
LTVSRRRVNRRVDPAESYAGIDYYRLAEKLREELSGGAPGGRELKGVNLIPWKVSLKDLTTNVAGIHYNPLTDRFLVATYTYNKVYEINRRGEVTWEFTCNVPESVYYVGKNRDRVLICERGTPVGGTGRVLLVDYATKAVKVYYTAVAGRDPQHAYPIPLPEEWDETHNVLITYRTIPGANPAIIEVNPEGDEVWTYQPSTPPLSVPSGAKVDENNRYVVVADYRNRVLLIRKSDLATIFQFGTTDVASRASGLMWYSECAIFSRRWHETIYATDIMSHRVVALRLVYGVLTWKYLPYYVATPSELVELPNGNIVVTSTTHNSLVELPTVFIDQYKPPNAYAKVWSGATVPAGGANSPSIPCLDYERKTIYLLSNQNGSLDIEIDPDGSGTFYKYLTGESVTASTTTPYKTMITYDAYAIRLWFNPVADATVHAWILLGGSE